MRVAALRSVSAIVVATAVLCAPLGAQDRLKSMPGYDQFQKMSAQIPGSVKLGSLAAKWKDDGSSFEYTWDGKRYRYAVATRQATVIGEAPAEAAPAPLLSPVGQARPQGVALDVAQGGVVVVVLLRWGRT